jgi:hypothetical protein
VAFSCFSPEGRSALHSTELNAWELRALVSPQQARFTLLTPRPSAHSPTLSQTVSPSSASGPLPALEDRQLPGGAIGLSTRLCSSSTDGSPYPVAAGEPLVWALLRKSANGSSLTLAGLLIRPRPQDSSYTCWGMRASPHICLRDVPTRVLEIGQLILLQLAQLYARRPGCLSLRLSFPFLCEPANRLSAVLLETSGTTVTQSFDSGVRSA